MRPAKLFAWVLVTASLVLVMAAILASADGDPSTLVERLPVAMPWLLAILSTIPLGYVVGRSLPRRPALPAAAAAFALLAAALVFRLGPMAAPTVPPAPVVLTVLATMAPGMLLGGVYGADRRNPSAATNSIGPEA